MLPRWSISSLFCGNLKVENHSCAHVQYVRVLFLHDWHLEQLCIWVSSHRPRFHAWLGLQNWDSDEPTARWNHCCLFLPPCAIHSYKTMQRRVFLVLRTFKDLDSKVLIRYKSVCCFFRVPQRRWDANGHLLQCISSITRHEELWRAGETRSREHLGGELAHAWNGEKPGNGGLPKWMI